MAGLLRRPRRMQQWRAPKAVVILSEAAASLREAAAQSKDPYSLLVHLSWLASHTTKQIGTNTLP